MAITYYMLQVSPWFFFISIVLFGGLFGTLVTFLIRNFVKVKVLKSHNEVTGFLFLAISSFYSLLLSFVVFVVWGQYNETQTIVNKEGSSAKGLYRDIKYYPDTVESKQLMVLYLDYVYHVIDEEFPNMENRKLSKKAPEAFNRVFYKMENLTPKNAFQTHLVAVMFNHLNELSTYKELRSASVEAEISPPLWLPIILGAILVIICATLLDIEHSRFHMLLTAMLGGFIGMLLFTIIFLDHPFSGTQRIKPKLYNEIFVLEKWADELPSKNSAHITKF